jgi:two-component system nitrate/nitrite sensor histidine kinase NarX
MELKTNIFVPEDSTSLITQASQILALFIALGLAGVISSILVSENISDGAAKINMVGSLRMLAARIPFSHFESEPPSPTKEIKNFQNRLEIIYSKSQSDFKSDQEFAALFDKIEQRWNRIKQQRSSVQERKSFASDLDNLVNYFQLKAEKDIRLLRLIQYLGFLVVLIVSYIAIYRLQNSLINPFRLLVQVATEAGQGNFSLRADESAKGELGLLAKSLNDMSSQLSLTYQDFEDKVANKTVELEQSNRSLSILYRSAHSLSHTNDLSQLLSDLEKTLGIGTISVVLPKNDDSPSDSHNRQTLAHIYAINKGNKSFGKLVWEIPQDFILEFWQEELLKTMSNLIATSSDIEHKRRAESRLEIMEERAVIARELHDSLAQSLSYLKLQTSLLNKQHCKGLPQEEITSTITEISKGTNQAYKQLREILTTFRLKLDSGSIENSIRDAVIEFSEKCNYTIELNYDLGTDKLSPHQEIHLLQIIREALSNIYKHAQASAATVNIEVCGNEVCVDIADNGCGQPETASKEGHFGLKIMEERAKSLGGTLKITQNNPSGTRILIQFNILSES